MARPDDRRYLETHEWHKVEGDLVAIGLTDHAANELTDITFVALPTVGTTVEAGQSWGEIESVKATSELYTGVTGTIAEVNDSLNDTPEQVNQDPFGAGWMIKIRPAAEADLSGLLSSQDYDAKYPD